MITKGITGFGTGGTEGFLSGGKSREAEPPFEGKPEFRACEEVREGLSWKNCEPGGGMWLLLMQEATFVSICGG